LSSRSALIAVFLVALDQMTKFLAVSRLTVNDSIPLMNGVLHITLTKNTGAAFGIFKGMMPLFIFISVVTIFIILLYAKNLRDRSPYLKNGLLLVLAGAVGNLIDRIRLGYVIDFIDVRFWSVFNIADTTISIGGALLVYHLFIFSRRKGSPDASHIF